METEFLCQVFLTVSIFFVPLMILSDTGLPVERTRLKRRPTGITEKYPLIGKNYRLKIPRPAVRDLPCGSRAG
jgi:hypothetical protein